MIGRTNAVSKPGVELSLVVSVTSGAAVTATKGSKTVNGHGGGRLVRPLLAGGRYMECKGHTQRANVRHEKRLRRR